MDFDYSPKTKALQTKLLRFMDEHIYPAEGAHHAEVEANTVAGERWTPLQTIEALKSKAKDQGLWNLFLPVDSAQAAGFEGGGLTCSCRIQRVRRWVCPTLNTHRCAR